MTPLEISIAIHYWCFPEPWKKGSENWTSLDSKIVQEMLERGLLETTSDGLTGNTPAMRCFIEGLEAVPWPIRIWTLPERTVVAVTEVRDE